MPKLEYPTLITWTDASGKVHVPPDPPLIDGAPSWIPRPNEYKRRTPLKKCPALACRRGQKCVSPLYGGYCQKTHMDRESFRWQLVAKIDAFMVANGIPVTDGCSQPYAQPGPEIKRALEEREAECLREELLKFQTGWINAQKRKIGLTPHLPCPTPPRNNHPLT